MGFEPVRHQILLPAVVPLGSLQAAAGLATVRNLAVGWVTPGMASEFTEDAPQKAYASTIAAG